MLQVQGKISQGSDLESGTFLWEFNANIWFDQPLNRHREILCSLPQSCPANIRKTFLNQIGNLTQSLFTQWPVRACIKFVFIFILIYSFWGLFILVCCVDLPLHSCCHFRFVVAICVHVLSFKVKVSSPPMILWITTSSSMHREAKEVKPKTSIFRLPLSFHSKYSLHLLAS